MMNPQGDGGTWGAVKDKAVTLLAIGQTRLELLGNELEVGRVTAMRQLMLAQALLFCVGLGVVLTVVGLALLFWEQRLMVVALSGALVWALALYFYVAMRRGSSKSEPLFNASLAELQEDLRQLKAASGHGRSSD
jgi:uncharacterized membrane protein YqjE